MIQLYFDKNAKTSTNYETHAEAISRVQREMLLVLLY